MFSELFAELYAGAIRRDCHQITVVRKLLTAQRLPVSEANSSHDLAGPFIDNSDFLGLVRLADLSVERSREFDDAMAQVIYDHRLYVEPVYEMCPICRSPGCINAMLFVTLQDPESLISAEDS